MNRGGVLLIMVVSLLLTAAGLAGAEHTPDHRYVITGTVTNDLGESVCGLTVRATDTRTPGVDGTSRIATTDGQGRFRIQLHLHSDAVAGENSNIGDPILVTVEGTSASTSTRADKNAANPDAWGQQTVSLVVPSTVKEQCIGLDDVALWGSGAAGVSAALIGGVWYLRRPRRARGARRELLAIPGVGRARARELDAYGIRSVEDLARADPDKLAKKTSLTPKQARLLVKRATGSLEDEEA